MPLWAAISPVQLVLHWPGQATAKGHPMALLFCQDTTSSIAKLRATELTP